MLLFLVGCAADVTYRETFLERRSQGTAIPGKIGIRILEPDEKLSLSPSSYTGWATKINFDIGRITKNKGNEIEFEILERLDKSEQRGCGDTLPKNYFI